MRVVRSLLFPPYFSEQEHEQNFRIFPLPLHFNLLLYPTQRQQEITSFSSFKIWKEELVFFICFYLYTLYKIYKFLKQI